MAQPIVKEKSKDHRRRKNPGARDAFTKQRHENNAHRGKQRWVPSTLDGKEFTSTQLLNFTDEELSRVVEAHWEREAL
jgi:hypothetical protein